MSVPMRQPTNVVPRGDARLSSPTKVDHHPSLYSQTEDPESPCPSLCLSSTSSSLSTFSSSNTSASDEPHEGRGFDDRDTAGAEVDFAGDYSLSVLLPKKRISAAAGRLYPINELLVHDNEDALGGRTNINGSDFCNAINQMYSQDSVSSLTNLFPKPWNSSDDALSKPFPPKDGTPKMARRRKKAPKAKSQKQKLRPKSGDESDGPPGKISLPPIPTKSALQTVRKAGDKTTKRSVSFYPRARIHRVPMREHLSVDVMEAIWYSAEDFEAFRKHCYDTLVLMAELEESQDENDRETPEIPSIFKDTEGNEYCRRGLEQRLPNAQQERQQKKKRVRTIVSAEQNFQDVTGLPTDPAWLASLVSQQSKACVQLALEAARTDALEAQLVHLDALERNEKRSKTKKIVKKHQRRKD